MGLLSVCSQLWQGKSALPDPLFSGSSQLWGVRASRDTKSQSNSDYLSACRIAPSWPPTAAPAGPATSRRSLAPLQKLAQNTGMVKSNMERPNIPPPTGYTGGYVGEAMRRVRFALPVGSTLRGSPLFASPQIHELGPQGHTRHGGNDRARSPLSKRDSKGVNSGSSSHFPGRKPLILYCHSKSW